MAIQLPCREKSAITEVGHLVQLNGTVKSILDIEL